MPLSLRALPMNDDIDDIDWGFEDDLINYDDTYEK